MQKRELLPMKIQRNETQKHGLLSRMLKRKQVNKTNTQGLISLEDRAAKLRR